MRLLEVALTAAALLALVSCKHYSCTCTKANGAVESFDKPSDMLCTDYAVMHPEKEYTSCIQTTGDLLGPESPVARMLWDTGSADPYWVARMSEKAGRSW